MTWWQIVLVFLTAPVWGMGVVGLVFIAVYGLIFRPWYGLYRGLRYKDWSEFDVMED